MDTALLFLRLALAAVFAVAGVAKLFDLPGSVSAVRGFGLPARFARPVGSVLPIVEMAIAVGLIAIASARFAALGGALLMGVFVAVIAANLARGSHPDCHCFGKLHSTPIGWQTLVRNAVLAGGAVAVAIAGPGSSLYGWLRHLDSTGRVLLALVIAALGVLGWQWINLERLTRTAAKLANRIATIEGLVNGDTPADVPGPAVGSAAPGFLLRTIGKGMVTLAAFTAMGKPTLLVFAEPTCSVCNVMMPKLARWTRDLAAELTVVVISSGGEEANRRKVERYGMEWVLLQDGREVTMAYRVPGAPSAVLVNRAGVVVDELAYGPDNIEALVKRVADATSTHRAAGVPAVAPPALLVHPATAGIPH